MNDYLGEFPVDLDTTPFAGFTPADWALRYIEMYGGIDGAHHKQWLIDQLARVLTGSPVNVVQAHWGNGHAQYRHNVSTSESYEAWVARMTEGEEGHDTYGWERGIAP